MNLSKTLKLTKDVVRIILRNIVSGLFDNALPRTHIKLVSLFVQSSQNLIQVEIVNSRGCFEKKKKSGPKKHTVKWLVFKGIIGFIE